MPEIDVMNTLGHKTRSMVTRYVIFDLNASRRAMEKLAEYRRTIAALAEAEKRLNPNSTPPGVEADKTSGRNVGVRLQGSL